MDSILGRTILGYNVIEKIGSGGFGDVYKVERTNIIGKTTRALKVITLPRDDEYLEVLNSMGGDRNKTNAYFQKKLNRVVNEIRVFSLISEKDNHNIVSYYENDVEKIGEYRYNIYILMELLTPLNKWLQQNNITVADGLDIGIGIANGLSICHKNNIIHRDIKLSNIFVSKDGAFKLGDFGVSKNINNTTMAHTIKGTPNYIAPEVYIGKSKYDNTVDIYSLGILMYYLFNKKRFPYYPEFPKEYSREDEDKAFYKRMEYDQVANPMCAPKNVAKAIKKAISKPEERYQNAVDFENDLIDARAKLSEKEIEKKIGFNPVFVDSNKIESEKENLLVQNLMGKNYNSISFQEQGITMDDSVAIERRKKRRKNLVIAISIVCILLLIGLILYFATGTVKNNKAIEETTIIVNTNGNGVTNQNKGNTTSSESATTDVETTTAVNTTKKSKKTKKKATNVPATQAATTAPATKAPVAYTKRVTPTTRPQQQVTKKVTPTKKTQPTTKKVTPTKKSTNKKNDGAIDFKNVVE